MPLEAKGKSFNALKPLKVLPQKDSPWNQLGCCVSPYEGGYQSGLPVKGVKQSKRGRQSHSVSKCVGTGRCVCMHLDVFVHNHVHELYVCLGGAHKSICAHAEICFQSAWVWVYVLSVCVGVQECTVPSSKQERSTVNSITTLSPCTKRWLLLSLSLFTAAHTTSDFLKSLQSLQFTKNLAGDTNTSIKIFTKNVSAIYKIHEKAIENTRQR